MIPLRLVFTVTCVLSIWTIGCALNCGAGQEEINGQCCDLCPPGTYVKEYCSDKQKTECAPCPEGEFSKQNIFDKCEKCRSCQQEYAEKCTLTTNSNCSCRSGFLCSDSSCSKCETNKCLKGEKLKRTESPWAGGVISYSYQCEPQTCPDNTYFDVKENICKTHRGDKDALHLILGIGFVLLSLTLLVFLSSACFKNLRKYKAYVSPVEVSAVTTNTSEFHLSKEESGLKQILQNDSKNTDNII